MIHCGASVFFLFLYMKKTALIATCIPLLCGGLFCLHLTAQPGSLPRSLNGFTDKTISLIDLKIEETSERELLELKVASRKKFADSVTIAFDANIPSGTLNKMMQAHADLAAAKAELYRHTGEREKLLIALEEKVSALTDKLQGVILQHNVGAVSPNVTVVSSDVTTEAEIQLLEAMLELKREQSANQR